MEFVARIQVERESGKFASRESIATELADQIGDIQLDTLGADGDSVYNIELVEVE